MDESNAFLHFIGQYWQIVFLYAFKYLSEMKKSIDETNKEIHKKLNEHDFDIKMIKYTQSLKGQNYDKSNQKE